VLVSFTDRFDPSTTDTNSGFYYSYDFNNDGDFTDPGEAIDIPDPSRSFVFPVNGSYVVHGRIRDKDGGSSDYYTTVIVNNADIVVIGQDKGGLPLVTVRDAETLDLKFPAFLAYAETYRGGVRVAVGDVNNDGVPDIITAPGRVNSAKFGVLGIKIFDGQSGQQLASPFVELLPFGGRFTRGFNIAAGDLNQDGFADIVVAPAGFAKPVVKVISGADGSILHEIQAYPKQLSYQSGVRLAVADVTGDHVPDIVMHAGTNGKSRIKVFNGATGFSAAVAVDGLNPFADLPPTAGAVHLATGDVNGDGQVDVIAALGKGQPLVRAFDVLTGDQLLEIQADAAGYRGGIRVAITDANGDGRADLIFGTGKTKGLPAHTRVIDGFSLIEIDDFFTDDSTFKGGVFVAGGK
jgi:hypothetical protein